LYIALGDLVDIGRECDRLGTELARLTAMIETQRRKLDNEQFTSRAPASVVQHERDKLASLRQQAAAIGEKRQQLGCEPSPSP
jgi:valyl-tRNA synthetase